jgi:hypothetical protein
MKEPRIKNAVMKNVDVSGSSGGNDGSPKTLGAFFGCRQAPHERRALVSMGLQAQLLWYITKRLLVKNGLYSETGA